VTSTRSQRERRRAVIAGLAIGAVALVAVLVVNAGTPAEVDPVAQAIGGRLVYVIVDDADPSFSRMWVWNLAAGEVRRGPQLNDPVQHLVRASDVAPDAVGSVSRTPDGGYSADLVRFLDPGDEAVSMVRGEHVAWAPRGEVAVGASALPGCDAVEVTSWNPRTTLSETEQLPCGEVVAIAASDLAAYLAVSRDGGPPTLDRVTPQFTERLTTGYMPVGASGSEVLLVQAGGPNDAEIGPALYVSRGSPERPAIDPVGEPGRSFVFEAVLEAGSGVLGDLVLGTYEGARGIYRLEASATTTSVVPRLVLETNAAVVGATSTDGGDVIAALGDRLVVIRGGVVTDLAVPGDGPPAGASIVWLPAAAPEASGP
jgi:hypothetical protein